MGLGARWGQVGVLAAEAAMPARKVWLRMTSKRNDWSLK